jgi:hypothetical protein
MARKIKTEDIARRRAKERALRVKRLATEEASSRREAESHPTKGTPPEAYLKERDALVTRRAHREKKPWSFREHMKKVDPEHWVTYDGRRIAVNDMEDTHVVNTVRLLRRHATAQRFLEALIMLKGPRPSGDEATHAFECALEETVSLSDDAFLKEVCPPFHRLLTRYDACEKRMRDEEDMIFHEGDQWGDS